MVGVMPCIDKKIMGMGAPNQSMNASNLDSSLATGANTNNNGPLSPTSASSARIIKSFSNGSKLDRTQSLRTHVRPLGAFNRNLDHSSATTDVSGFILVRNINSLQLF